MASRSFYFNYTKFINFILMRSYEEKPVYYTYINNGKEYFTSNIDLAWKRSDEGTEPKTIINPT